MALKHLQTTPERTDLEIGKGSKIRHSIYRRRSPPSFNLNPIEFIKFTPNTDSAQSKARAVTMTQAIHDAISSGFVPDAATLRDLQAVVDDEQTPADVLLNLRTRLDHILT